MSGVAASLALYPQRKANRLGESASTTVTGTTFASGDELSPNVTVPVAPATGVS